MKRYIRDLSFEKHFCEECNQEKHVVVTAWNPTVHGTVYEFRCQGEDHYFFSKIETSERLK